MFLFGPLFTEIGEDLSHFSAFGESRYFHSTPSPSVLTYILHLLLMRLFSFPVLGQCTLAKMTKRRTHSWHSSTMKIFIRHILL